MPRSRSWPAGEVIEAWALVEMGRGRTYPLGLERSSPTEGLTPLEQAHQRLALTPGYERAYPALWWLCVERRPWPLVPRLYERDRGRKCPDPRDARAEFALFLHRLDCSLREKPFRPLTEQPRSGDLGEARALHGTLAAIRRLRQMPPGTPAAERKRRQRLRILMVRLAHLMPTHPLRGEEA
jgi:hypothetical protein